MMPERIRKTAFNLLVCLILQASLLCPSALAEGKTSIPFKQFQIEQESFRLAGVWVSRPKQLDEDIAEFLSVNKIFSLDDYSRWLAVNTRYQKDPANQWLSPGQFLNKKQGDCEDYASLTLSVVRVFGYRPRFLALLGTGRSHAICTFEKDGYFIWFDNAAIKKTKAKSINDFAQTISRQYNYSSLAELNPQTNRWTVLYKKS